MEKVMLSFDKVSAHYGKIQALHEVSLHTVSYTHLRAHET